MAFASESPAKILEALIESLASPGLNSLAGNQIQRLLISKQLEQVFEDFQVNLQDLKCSGLLHRLCGLVSHKDIFVQHEASRVLLEALKYSGGPSGISELASVPGFMQSLLDSVSSMVQVQHTAFDLAAQDTSLAADGSWIQTSSSNAAAVTLLWRMSDVERSKLLECSPSLAQILLGLLGSVSAGVRAAATGTLINLAVIPEVLGQLSQNKDLLPLLLGLLGKGAESQVNKPQEDPARRVSGFGSFMNVEVSTTAHTGNQYADSGGYNVLAYTSVPGKDVKKSAGRPAGGSVSVSASWDLQQRSEYDVEQDVVVQMHASGLVSLLASCRESAEQLLISERALQRLIKGLSITSLLPRLIETNRQCRESCGRALLSLMVALPGPDTAEKVVGLLGGYIEARRDDLDAMILLSSNSGLRQALEHVMRRTVEEAGKMASVQTLRVETEQLSQAGDSLASWIRPCQQALFTLHMLALKSSHSVAGLCCLDSDNQVKDSVSAGQHCLLLDNITQIALGTTRTQPHQTSLSKHGVTGGATSTAVSLVPDPLWFGLQTHACGVLALFTEHLVALGRSEVVSESLARSLFKLPDLAELLLASEPEIAVGGPTATSCSPDDLHKGFVAALMSVVCRHGPITSHAFTQVLLQAPGSLGAIMQLLAMSCLETSAQPPSPRLSPSQQRKHLLSQQQLLSPLSDDDFGTTSTARPSSPLRGAQRMKQRKPSLRQLIIKVPINAGGQDIEDDDLPNLRSPTSVERSSPSSSRLSCDDKQHGAVVQKLSAAVGVVAALHLCTAAADSSSGVANVIATRSSVISTLFSILQGTCSGLHMQWPHTGVDQETWVSKLNVLSLQLLSSLLFHMEESVFSQVIMRDASQLIIALEKSLTSLDAHTQSKALGLLLHLMEHEPFKQVMASKADSWFMLILDCLGTATHPLTSSPHTPRGSPSSHHLPAHCQLDPEGLSCACSCLAHMAQAFPSVLSNLTYAPGFIDLIMRYVALFVNDALLETSSPHHSAQLLSLACLTEVISLAANDCISSPLEDSTSHPGSSGTIFSSYAGDQQRAFSSTTSRISPSLGGNSSNSLHSNSRTANSSFLGHLVEMPGVTDLICTCASLHNLDEQAARSATSRLLRKSLSRFARFASDLRALVRQGAQQGDQVQIEHGPEDEEHVAYIEPALHAARLHAVVTLRCIAVHWARKMRRDIQSQLDLTEEISDLLSYENRNPIMSTWPQRPATGLKPPTPLHSTQVSFLAQSLRSRVMEASSLAGDTVSTMPAGSPKASSQLLLPSLPIVSLLPSARYASSSGIMSPSNKYYVLGSPTHRGRVPERPARESMKLKELAQICCQLMTLQESSELRLEAVHCLSVLLRMSEQVAAYCMLTVPQLLDHLVALLSINVCGATLEARTEAALTAASNQHKQLNRLDSTKSQETKLVWSAETVSVAMSLMCLLSTNQWVGPRIASHSALAEAIDSVLEEETYLQVRAMSTTFPTKWRGQFQRTALLDSDDLSLFDCNDLPLAHKDLQVCAMELVSTLANQFASHSPKAGNRFVGSRLSLLLTIDRLLLQASQASGGPSSTTDSSSGGTPRPTQHSLETTGLCLQTLIAIFHWGGMDALLSAPPRSTSSVATSLVSNSIFKSLVLYLRHPEPGLRLKAVGVVAAAAQHLPDEKLPTLGAVEGLVYALLDVMQSANDVLFRSLRSSSNTLSSAVSMTASGAFSVDQLPDSSVLEAYQNQLLWGLAAAAALARCPQIAARLVSLKALPAVLRTALRCRVGDVPIYAAGLTGNLCNHLACQPVVASSRGLAQELIRQGREALTFEHLAVVLGAVRNFACNERGRQELSGEPGTVPLLCKLLIREWPANLAAAAPFMSEDLSNEISMLVSAALCNLSGDVVGLEALLMEQDAVLSAVTSILKDLVPVSLLSSGIIQAPHGGPVHGCGKLSCAWCTGKCKAAGMRPEIVSRVRCFNAVTLANITSHPVLVRNVLVSSGEVARLCMLMLMTLPTPSTQALCEDPLACFRSGTQRMASVSILITLKNLLLALRHPEAPSAWRRHQSALAPSLHRGDSTASAAEDGTQSMTSAHPPPPPAKEQLGGVSRPFSPRHVKNSRIRGLTASQAASVTPASALDVLDQAISPGRSTGGTGLSLLFDQVVDLLSWVDFTAAADVYAVDSCSTFGADVAGASAAVLSMFAVHGLPERYPKYTETALQCLIRILILPTLLPEPPASYHSTSSDTAAALEVSASHSAMALWALVSNPECTSWGEKLASNVTSLRVLLAAVKKGQRRGGTKARFAGSRMMSALTLGQLVVQGLVEPSFLHRLLDPDSGIMSSLVDLIPLALPQFRRSLGPVTRYKHNQGGHQARGVGGTAPQQGQGQQAGPGGGSGRINAIYTSGPWDAVLDMLGVSSGDMRYAMGLQAAGALAHLLSCKCPEASVTPSLDVSVILPILEALLSCSEEEVLLSTVMLISSLASSGLRRHCGNLIKSEWLMIKVIEVCATSIEYGALSSGHRLSNNGGRSKSSTSERSKILLILKSQAYAAVALGNLVLPEEDVNGKMRVVQKDCVDALAQLLLTPLTGLPVASADKELAQIQLSVAVAAAAALRNVTSCMSEADIASEGDGRLMGSVLALMSGIKQMLYMYETDLALLGAVEQLLQYLFGIIANLATLAECKGRLLKERSLVSVLTIALEAKGTSSLGGGFHMDYALQLAALAAISNLLLPSDRPGGQGSLVIIDQSEPSLSTANDPMVDVCSTAQLNTPRTKRSTTQDLQADGSFPEENSFKQRTKEMLGVGTSYYHQRTDHLKGETCQKSDISHHPSESSSSSSEAAHMSLSELHSIVGDEFQMLRMDTRSSGGLIPEEVGLEDLLNGLKVDVGVAVGVGLSSGTMDDEVPEEEEALLASGSQHTSGQGVDREPLRVLQRGFLTALDMGMSHQVRQTLQHLGHSDMVPEEYQHMVLWIQTLLLH